MVQTTGLRLEIDDLGWKQEEGVRLLHQIDDDISYSDVQTPDPEKKLPGSKTHTSRYYPSHSLHSALRAAADFLRSFLVFLIPSFIQTRLFPPSDEANVLDAKIPKVAYLDGLRGIASFVVVIYHVSWSVFKATGWGWRSGKAGLNDHIIQLPVLRLLFSGYTAVSMFFVISGFALSIKPVRQMRDPETEPSQTLKTVMSATIRRPFRLYMPMFVATFIPFLLIRMGAYDAIVPIRNDKHIISGGPTAVVHKNGTFFEQLEDWGAITSRALNILGPSAPTKYNGPIWTIPIEFRCSLALYLTHMATCAFKPRVRMGLVTFLILFATVTSRVDLILFWAGYLLADIDGYFSSKPIRSPESRSSVWRGRATTVALVLNFVCGLWLASYPQLGAEKTPGYIWLSGMIPSYITETKRWWCSIGSIQIVLSVSRLPALGRFFSCSIFRYLGNISFGLYLVHWWLLHVVGYPVFKVVWTATGKDTIAQTYFGFAVAFSFFIIVCIWVSDMFWRGVDIPSVRFARWVEKRCLR